MRLLYILSLVAAFLPAISAAVLAIDYGAEFTKLSLVKPGVPFDVVLDRDSKRKIQSVVGWKREDRVFGQEGKMSATRFPDTHFPYVKPLLGRDVITIPAVYPTPPVLGEDGSVTFPHPSPPPHLESHSGWTPTEVLAHQLSYYRALAEELAGTSITQAVVTVPAWWSASQRRAYRDALELQGMTCLAMIGEGTGVALNFAMTRSFPTYDLETGQGEKEVHVVYDSGALGTTATVLAFYQTEKLPYPKSKTPIVTTHVDVLGTGWEEIGGVWLDLALQEWIVDDFISKSGKKAVRGDKRAMAKIGREAVRVKHILSANQENNIAIESLYDDVDYRGRISRTVLEEALAPSIDLFAAPISSALSASGIPLDNVTSVILFGGNTRVPFVQGAIRSVLGGDEKIAQNVNADEAAVLGAAYYGAALSRQFKMKNLEVVERSVGDITMGPGQVLFPRGSRLGEKKSLTFSADKDLTLEFDQDGKPLLQVSVVDIAAALANFTSPQPVVNLTMRLDPRGHLSVANAVLVSNTTTSKDGGVTGALKGLFGGKDKKEEDSAAAEEETVATGKTERVALRFREKHLGVKSMSSEERRATQAKLAAIAAYEKAKTAREEARNVLEGYLYRLQGLLDDGSENRALHDFATEAERKALHILLDETFAWLSDHAETAEEKVLRGKRADLEKLESPIITRFQEHRRRPKSLEDFQQAMFAARAFFVEAHKNNTAAIESASAATVEDPSPPPKYTEKELKEVEEMLKDNEKWVDGLMKVQVKLDEDKTSDPVIFSKDLDERGKKLQSTVLRLVNKKPPRAPRPKTTSTTSSASATTSTGTSPTEPAFEDPFSEHEHSSPEEPNPVADSAPEAEPEEVPEAGDPPLSAEEDEPPEPEAGGVPKHEEL